MKGDTYRWQVTLYGQTVVVTAQDKLEATKEAAKLLGVAWSKEARQMYCMRMSKVR